MGSLTRTDITDAWVFLLQIVYPFDIFREKSQLEIL